MEDLSLPLIFQVKVDQRIDQPLPQEFIPGPIHTGRPRIVTRADPVKFCSSHASPSRFLIGTLGNTQRLADLALGSVYVAPSREQIAMNTEMTPSNGMSSLNTDAMTASQR